VISPNDQIFLPEFGKLQADFGEKDVIRKKEARLLAG
jgi:hypothetical protein